MNNICPVCGYNGLNEPPYDSDGYPSYDICACCGFEFGFDDGSEGLSFETYRKDWIGSGAKWIVPEKKPVNWSLEKQLGRIRG